MPWILYAYRLNNCNLSLLLCPALRKVCHLRTSVDFTSRDLTTPYNQYVKRATPAIISARLSKAERNVNTVAPNKNNAILRTRIQRCWVDASELISFSSLFSAVAVLKVFTCLLNENHPTASSLLAIQRIIVDIEDLFLWLRKTDVHLLGWNLPDSILVKDSCTSGTDAMLDNSHIQCLLVCTFFDFDLDLCWY